MIISFTTVFLVAASLLAATLLTALGGVLLARSARAEAREARSVAEVAGLRLATVETALAGAEARLQALLDGQERAAAAPPVRPSLREAVALSRHGAGVDELVATCRIGEGEARLIQMLYGPAKHGAERPADVH